ncbi:ATP-binding protein [Halomicroarcula limicola]|uniref:ATP-binding protein n=1 Tax=Haloarcula limicola TaxID=1429915 RepID=A0A8J7YB62_9EURY|nr:ATP-binding protein [Halomicroarcula limicola]MBV0925014.1 ATP-binding protein [Halomicroarcula limicola]
MSTIQDRLRSVRGETSQEQREEALSSFHAPVRNTQQATGDTRRHTDADSIRREFGIPAWDRSKFAFDKVIPNYVERHWQPPTGESVGGTDFLATGKPGSGKSTLGCYFATRDIEVNNSMHVWRGTSSRSEWLPLAPWVTLCLPKGADVSVRLESKLPSEPSVTLDVDDLDRIVREVVYYEDPVHLCHDILERGSIHVVYPDPTLRGCQAVYEESDEKQYDAPSRGQLFHEEDPATHWWFGFILARVEHGPLDWTTITLDEIGDIVPQSVQKDQFGSYQKAEMLKDSWVDARKTGLTLNLYGHDEVDIWDGVRRKIRWRIQMPGRANPTTAGNLVGFESVPMHTDQTSMMDVGQALMYTETNFEAFAWSDIPTPHSYKLKITVN